MTAVAVFPGSFDPLTNGHSDIVDRASQLFDKIYVAIGENSTKPRLFPVESCIRMITEVFAENPKVEVISYTGLTVDLCKKLNSGFILRGIRNVSDYEYERSLAHMNRKLNSGIDTLFFDTSLEYLPISSTIIRELIKNNGDISQFVPPAILKYIRIDSK